MTTQEFSNEFDVLYNNIMSNQAPGLNEYEKSVFLTKAQDEIVKNHFNAKSNVLEEGFDASAKRQIDFSSLLFTKKLDPINSVGYPKLHPGSSIFRVDASILIIVNETVKLDNNILLSVVPISYSEINQVLIKPYKYPPKNIAWRFLNNIELENSTGNTEYGDWKVVSSVIKGFGSVSPGEEGMTGSETLLYDLNNNLIGKKRTYITNINNDTKTYEEQVQIARIIDSSIDSGELIAEVVTAFPTSNCDYIIRYIKRPTPIILVDLNDNYGGLSINGVSTVSECELDVSLHTEILQRAVELAKSAYLGDVNTTVELGKRSE